MLYYMEMLARERHERVQREAEERRLHRLVGGRPKSPTKPRFVRLFGRS